MVTIDFNDITKKGLKSLLQKFDKAGLPVTDVAADNKSKREAGYAVKTATLTFESGQTLALKFKASGDLFQAKLNGKVLAIKEYHKAETFTNEVIVYVQANEPSYLKNKEKQLARTKVAVPKVKVASTTIAEQITAYSTSLEELRGQKEAIGAQVAAIQPVVAEKQTTLSGIQAQLAAENAKSAELQEKLEKARQGIFESAGYGEELVADILAMGFDITADGRIYRDGGDGKTGMMGYAGKLALAKKRGTQTVLGKTFPKIYTDGMLLSPAPVGGKIRQGTDFREAITEAAGAAPAALDRLQIANDMMHGDGRHPKLKAAFVEGFNNSCDINDAIAFIESFSDEELLALLKDEENILEGVQLLAGGKTAFLPTASFLTLVKAPEGTPILEAIAGFNMAQGKAGTPARAVFECADCTTLEKSPVQASQPLEGEVQGSHDRRGTYAYTTEETGWSYFQDTTVVSPYSYPAPVVATSGARGDCPKCGAETVACNDELAVAECPSCGVKIDREGQIISITDNVLESAKPEPIRISAKTTKDGRVHVLFQDGGRENRGGKKSGYYMDRATYRSISLDDDATPSMYAKHGKIEKAPADFIWESATEVTLKGIKEEGDEFAGKQGIILESTPTEEGHLYKVKVDDLIYRRVPGMLLEGIGLEIDRSGEHEPNDPAHIDDPDHEKYGDKAKACPWCGSDVREERCIQCNRQYPMAVKDREAWIAANKPLPADDFPSQYE